MTLPGVLRIRFAAGLASALLCLSASFFVKGADTVASEEGDAGGSSLSHPLAKGRAQYLAGDSDRAEETFRAVLDDDPENLEAVDFLSRIQVDRASNRGRLREATRSQMVAEVGRAWQRPGVFQERAGDDSLAQRGVAPLARKLEAIVIPHLAFSNVDLQRVAQSLSVISEDYDDPQAPQRGVNILVVDPTQKNPGVTLALKNMSLKRVLDFVCDTIGYQYEIQADAVVVRPGGETSSLDTAFFPVTRSTVIRMTGMQMGGSAGSGTTPGDPRTPSATGPDGRLSGDGIASFNPPPSEAQALRGFLQSAGVNFDAVAGASLAYDGSALIVTQTPRNIERVRNILNRYNDVRQVEIEAKFIEVQEGALDELGVTWNVNRRGIAKVDPGSGQPVLDGHGRQVFTPQETYSTAGVNRSLAGAFGSSANGNAIVIDGQPVASTAPPRFPGAVALAAETAGFATISGRVGEFNVNAFVRALAQKTGSDLLSAPRLTVLSGNTANITVAQELRYPQSYGQIQSQVGTAPTGGESGGSAGVTITAGTPQDFTSRNVGVELKVTPTVEEDDYSISLDLAPKVTEFEGFVEYGGPSVAVSGGRTVTVPPGFYQPIFSVREVTTRVTLWDGATLIMGGLTREEVKKVSDKVPILGDIPVLGRAFRSKGQSSQKRNLLIFVTANLVSPGGALKKQRVGEVPPNTLFQNPTVITPAGPEPRMRK